MANGEQAFEPNSIEDFHSRAVALADEAKQYGVEMVVGLIGSNPLRDESEYMCNWTGGPVTILGMCEYIKMRARKNLKDTAPDGYL